MRPVRVIWSLLLPAALAAAGCSDADGTQPAGNRPMDVVTVDTLVRYQTMTGWEATAQGGQGEAGFAGWRDELARSAVNDLGITRLRLEVTSGSENRVDYHQRALAGTSVNERCERYATINDNADPRLLDPAGFHFSRMDSAVTNIVMPMRDALRGRGEKLFLNLNYVAFIDQCGRTAFQYHHSDPAEYAEFVLAAFLHLRDEYELVPDAVEVILEPDNVSTWNGLLIGQAIVATAARLAEHGFRPAFIAPSASRASNVPRLIRDIMSVPGAAQHVTEVSYHRYGGGTPAVLREIAALSANAGLKTSMLEQIGSDVESLHDDLTIANASAWQQFTLGFPAADNGAQYYTIENGRPVPGKRTRYLRQYFHYVRPGAQRVSAAGTSQGLRTAAFVHPDGKTVVVVHTRGAGAVEIRGLPEASYGASVTTASVAGLELPHQDAGGANPLTFDAPGKGVMTIYTR